MSRTGEVAGLEPLGTIDLPEHVGPGGFDHAAVDRPRELLYVAHTANDAVDVIDLRTERYVRSVPGLAGVAGVLVDEASARVFTSNRRENTVGLFPSRGAGAVERSPAFRAPAETDASDVTKVAVGVRPNGLAYDPGRGVLLCANIGDPDVPGTPSVTLVDVRRRAAVASLPMPGRTRWAVFDASQSLFFVNIADPPVIVAVDVRPPLAIVRQHAVPARGPHGLELDPVRGRLYCACDDATLVTLDARSGDVLATVGLAGAPDVVFLDAARSRLYVAIGDPGVLQVVDVEAQRSLEVFATEPGAHTIAFDSGRGRVYAFMPGTHRAAVFGSPATREG